MLMQVVGDRRSVAAHDDGLGHLRPAHGARPLLGDHPRAVVDAEAAVLGGVAHDEEASPCRLWLPLLQRSLKGLQVIET